MENRTTIETILNRITELRLNGDLSESDLVQIIELSINLAGIYPVSGAVKLTGKTYNGLIKTRPVIEILGKKCVILN
jgi:hypothetical protein